MLDYLFISFLRNQYIPKRRNVKKFFSRFSPFRRGKVGAGLKGRAPPPAVPRIKKKRVTGPPTGHPSVIPSQEKRETKTTKDRLPYIYDSW